MAATAAIVERPVRPSSMRRPGRRSRLRRWASMAAARWMPGDGWFGRVPETAPTCVIAVALLLALHRRRSAGCSLWPRRAVPRPSSLSALQS
ncbi:hypothetical protein [Nocardia terpenica]|uniref:hypothetical protein n=1 Tax=Nocardia terpenica TaxID=455432 RepID=UPI0018E08181|nr:hypothetical protein [Nocardia terpenica]